ncbi:MAG: hypothetical protein OXI49_15555 [Acidobacteriota bacterium]|nr:hypothetical protein [Acidobacteriota bacterium]
MRPSGTDRTTAAEADAAELRGRLLRGLKATDRRLRLNRALKTLTWFAPAACLWLLATWLLGLGAAGGADTAFWPSWAGGAALLLLGLREAAALGRDLPAAARAVDRAGDLHDVAATALEMQYRLDDSRADRRRESDGTVWPLPWIALVLERAVAGLEGTGPRQTVPRLVPGSALPSVGICLVLLLPVALPRSFVGEALAAAMNGDAAGELPPGFEAAALLEDDPNRMPGVPEFDVRLSDLPLVTLRLREPNADDGARSGDATDAADGSLGDGAEAEALDATAEGGDAAANALTDGTDPETGADLMRELDNREGTGEEEQGTAPGTEGSGEGAEPGAEAGEGDGSGGQPVEDGEGSGGESGAAAAISDEPGSSDGEADGAAAGVGTGPQEEMVDPFGDLLVPALSLEQALETALIESIEEIERRPLTTTSATQFRAAEVAMRGPATGAAGEAAASGGDLPAARHPIAWRHRESVRRYLEALEAAAEEDGE